MRKEVFRSYRTIKTAVVVLIASLVLGCEKEESALDPIPYEPPAEGTQIVQVNILPDYSRQIYFDLSQAEIKSDIPTETWELGLASVQGKFTVVLNEALVMKAADAGRLAFESLTSINGLEFNYDHPQHKEDSLAVKDAFSIENGQAVSNQHVYVIDLGKDPQGKDRGYRKMMFSNVDSESYTLRVANLDGSGEAIKTVYRNSTHDFIYLSLVNGINEVTEIPSMNDWDLVFGRYIHYFYEEDGVLFPYAVTGALLNSETAQNIEAVESYDAIDLEYALSQSYSSQRDLIGYDWKVYDFTDGYIVDDQRVYIVKDKEGYFYKLKFLDFLTASGVKGAITFEYQRL